MHNYENDCDIIIKNALAAANPYEGTVRALSGISTHGKIVLVSIGKAAWTMARAAADTLGDRIDRGLIATKYHHSKGAVRDFEIIEAGHPVLDENSVLAGTKALQLVEGLGADDTVLFLVSGGGSALFEKPLVPLARLAEINKQLLACGADITEINTIRKRLSGIKGGRFAEACAPAHVFAVVLSDVLGDRLDTIASGPAYPDSATCAQAKAIIAKHNLVLSDDELLLLERETPKKLDNVDTVFAGSLAILMSAAESACRALGYETHIITETACCEARTLGSLLAQIARENQNPPHPLAYLCGGETVVKIMGTGLGGRNQEAALAAAIGLDGLDAAMFSLGSDGTDGPTDAAGGIVDGSTAAKMLVAGIDPHAELENNNSNRALDSAGALLITGPTGTNVNDLAVLLIR